MQPRLVTALVVGAVMASSGCAPQAPTAEVGDCLQMDSVEGEVTEIPTVDCTQSHDGQVVMAFDMPGEDYPSEEEWTATLEEKCLEGFEEFVGIAYADSALSVRDLSPTEESWEAGDRQVLCIAFTDAEPATESFEDAEI
ncbi:MAG: septum formation family protein [Ornithinimicrobium sp.]